MARRNSTRKVSIVGAGRVGTALAVLLHRKGFRIVSIINHSQTAARYAALQVGCKRYSHRVADLHPDTELLIIAVTDEATRPVAEEIARTTNINFSRLVVAHTSGILTSEELQPLTHKGATVFSFHPIQSFPKGNSLTAQLHAMKGITYGVEGSPKSIRFARRLAKRLGGSIVRVPKEEKILYHLACVVASNYSVALLGAVEELTRGVGGELSLRHFKKLIESSIENSLRLSPRNALTGPVARGSVKTVQAHLRQLSGKRRHLRLLYKTVGLYALTMTKENLSRHRSRQLEKNLRGK